MKKLKFDRGKKPAWLIEPPFEFNQPFLPSQHVVAYDIEAGYPNYFCCVAIGEKNDPVIYTLDNLHQMVLQLSDKRLILTSFNNLAYDDYVMKYIFLEIRQQQTSNLREKFGVGDLMGRIYQLNCELIKMPRSGEKPGWYWDLWRTPTPWAFSIDVFQIPIPKMGLKERACERHTISIEETPVPFGHPVDKSDIPGINFYCVNDVRETIREFNLVGRHIDLRKKLGELYPSSDVISKHNAGICEEIITREYCLVSGLEKKYIKGGIARPGKKIDIKDCLPPWTQFESVNLNIYRQILQEQSGRYSTDDDRETLSAVIDFQTPNVLRGDPKEINKIIREWSKDKGFAVKVGAGGLHSLDWPLILEPGENELLFEIDVASFYPGLIRSMRLKPDHMGEQFNEILNKITTMRLEAKAKKEALLAEALKIVINSAFGKTGNQYSILFDEKMQLQVTLGGQVSLLMLIEQLLKKKINIVSANTDGIVVLIPKSKKFIVDGICRRWERATGQVLEETQYKKYVRRDVNNYLVVKASGSTKEKGIFKIPKPEKDIRKRRNKAEILSEALRAYFIEGITPADYIMDHSADLTKFIFSFHVGQDWNLYHKHHHLGVLVDDPILKTSRWYVSKLIKRDKNGYRPHSQVGDVYKSGRMTARQIQTYKETHKTDEHPDNWIKHIRVENGQNAVIINRLPDKLPEDLDYTYYTVEVEKMIQDIEKGFKPVEPNEDHEPQEEGD